MTTEKVSEVASVELEKKDDSFDDELNNQELGGDTMTEEEVTDMIIMQGVMSGTIEMLKKQSQELEEILNE